MSEDDPWNKGEPSLPRSLSDKLASIHCIDELYGFANRRKVLGIYDESIIPKWTDEEVALIVERKFELQKLAAKGKRK